MTQMNATQVTHPSASPANNQTAQVLVRMDPALREELEALAKLEQRSLSGATRIMIQRGISQYKTESIIAD